jgi:hypothetical protein
MDYTTKHQTKTMEEESNTYGMPRIKPTTMEEEPARRVCNIKCQATKVRGITSQPNTSQSRLSQALAT